MFALIFRLKKLSAALKVSYIFLRLNKFSVIPNSLLYFSDLKIFFQHDIFHILFHVRKLSPTPNFVRYILTESKTVNDHSLLFGTWFCLLWNLVILPLLM